MYYDEKVKLPKRNVTFFSGKIHLNIFMDEIIMSSIFFKTVKGFFEKWWT